MDVFTKGNSKMGLSELKKLLRMAWSKETSADPEGWTPKNPSWWQCVPSILVGQDFVGGRIFKKFMKVKIDGQESRISHFFIRLPDGQEIDLTKEQFLKLIILSEEKPRSITRARLFRIEHVRRRYALLRLRIENLLHPNPLFSDPIYQMCLETALTSGCQKMKFGCVVLCRQGNKEKIAIATANKTIEPLRDICEPECIRLKIQARTESMLGACGHAEEWALWETVRLNIPLESCSLYIAGFYPENSKPWIKKERVHTCLRCAVQMYMAGVGKIYVPVIDRWEHLTPAEALKTAKAYALKEKEIN